MCVYPVTKVCQDLEGQRSRLAENLKFVTSNSQKTEKTLQKFDTVKVERNSQIDEYFDGLIKRLEATKALFKDEFNEHCSSKQAQLASALAEYQKQSKKIEKAKVKIESTVKDISRIAKDSLSGHGLHRHRREARESECQA